MGELIRVCSIDQLRKPADSCAKEFCTAKGLERYRNALFKFMVSLARNPSIEALACLRDEGTYSRKGLRPVVFSDNNRHKIYPIYDRLSESLGFPIVRQIVIGCYNPNHQVLRNSNSRLILLQTLIFDRNELKL